MKDFLTPSNIIAYSLLTIWFVYSIGLIIKAKKNYKTINQYIFNSIPSVFTTIGIFGTFLGIFWGLLKFNTDADMMQESISQLLSGLKTAFTTSLFGLFFSFIFSRIVLSIKYKAELKGVVNETTELKALNQITEILKSIETTNTHNLVDLKNSFIDSNKSTRKEIIEQKTVITEKLTDFQDKSHSLLELLSENLTKSAIENKELLSGIFMIIEDGNKINKETTNLKLQQIIDLNTATNEINKKQFGFILENQKQTEIILKSNNSELIKTINSNNAEFIDKFNKFYTLLEENTTKAFVEAMEKLTTSFNEQMNELIARLVKENFQELNNSVKRLNDWQIQNKEQIETLINQFKQVANDFETSSSAIEQITTNTKKLTDDESHLVKLIKQLQKVMIEDTKFIELTENLTKSALAIDKTSEQLVNWTQNDYEFHTAVKILIEQLNQMKDIKNGFWKGARTEMNKVLKSINEATNGYQSILDNRDNQFSNWLTTTLKNMDRVMLRHIENTNN